MTGADPGITLKNAVFCLLSLPERRLKIQCTKGQGRGVLSVEIIKKTGAGRGLRGSP